MTPCFLWRPAGIAFLLLAAVPAFACPHWFRDGFRNPGPAPIFPLVAPAPDQARAEPPVSPAPGPLVPPADQVLLFTCRAEGVQIYECRPKKDDPDAFEWAFKAPEATLFDDTGEKVGTHTAGPAWVGNDGSKVVGVKKAAADAPGGRAVPWLLLRVESHEGAGAFAKATYIQRVDTWAGLPPATGATKENAGKLVRVKYEATYCFYGPADAAPAEDAPPTFSKEMREAVDRMADLAAKGKDEELRTEAAAFAKEHANDADAFVGLKLGLLPRKKGGLGLGARAGVYDPDGIELFMIRQTRPTAKPMTTAELQAAADDLTRAANVLQAMAELTRPYGPKEKKPGKEPKEWARWADEMGQGAVDLKAAIKAEKPDGVRKAFLTLRGSCEACHAAFRD